MINKITIVGSGLMGRGVAQVAATAGQKVCLIDTSDEILGDAVREIQWSLAKLDKKGKLKEAPQDILKRITAVSDPARGVSDADLIIEAVFENISLKKRLAAEIDRNAPKHAILATNTSSLSITIIAEATKRPEKVVGMHWFNPAQITRLVEVTKSKYNNDETLAKIIDLCKVYGKDSVIAQRDVWFFLAVRAKFGFSFEANLMYLRGDFTPEEIDACIKYRLDLPMGEFELMDFTGAVDIRTASLKSTEEILEVFPQFEPSPIFLSVFRYLTHELWQPMSQRGLNGIKSGKGFYKYPRGKYARPEIPEDLADKIEPVQLLAISINLASSCVTAGIGSIEDINKVCRLAYGWPKGIFEYVDDYGPDNVIGVLKEKEKKAPKWLKRLYKPDPLLVTWK